MRNTDRMTTVRISVRGGLLSLCSPGQVRHAAAIEVPVRTLSRLDDRAVWPMPSPTSTLMKRRWGREDGSGTGSKVVHSCPFMAPSSRATANPESRTVSPPGLAEDGICYPVEPTPSPNGYASGWVPGSGLPRPSPSRRPQRRMLREPCGSAYEWARMSHRPNARVLEALLPEEPRD